jgi:Lecithin retinol acyltransferase
VFTRRLLHFHSARSHQLRGPHHAGVPVRQRSNSIALCGGDRLLSGNEEPALGAHLVTPRLAFAHHGIYVGGGNVVHYGALARQFRRAPVAEASLAFFAHGRAVLVRPHSAPRFDCQEVIRRARSRLREDRYGLLRNNCEHFCEWCVQGVPRSFQVERVLKVPRVLARAIRATFLCSLPIPDACLQARLAYRVVLRGGST